MCSTCFPKGKKMCVFHIMHIFLLYAITFNKVKEFPPWCSEESVCGGLGCCGGMGLIPCWCSGLKDPALPQLQRGSWLWFRFDPWPGNFPMPWVWPLKKKKKVQTPRRCFNIFRGRVTLSQLYS